MILREFTKTFARSDYDGLNEKEAAELQQKRSKIAKELKAAYDKNKQQLNTLRKAVEKKVGETNINPTVQKKIIDSVNKVGDKLNEPIRQAAEKRARKAKEEILNRRTQENELANGVSEAAGNKNTPKTEPTTTTTPKTEGKVDKKVGKSGVFKRAVEWTKKHPKLAIGGTLGAAALGTGGYLGYQHYKNKNKR